jgi:hypothetical protein
MIRLVEENGGTRVECDLAPGAVAYVDADWLVADCTAIPAIIADSSGTVRWCDEQPVALSVCADPAVVAGTALYGVAEDAVAALDKAALKCVHVIGVGAVAAAVRTLLAARQVETNSGEPPSAIIDTTGAPTAVIEATKRVASLGTVVLAGEPLDRALTADLYPDIHVRGLRVIGVKRPCGPRLSGVAPEKQSLPEPLRGTLVHVSCGDFIEVRAGHWYALAGLGVSSAGHTLQAGTTGL